uniref:ARB-07466-like C-terminal domain-containing protein n=1 Tax=Plectus sambesii TaxID=2011161 RepID=A0A914XDK4_9BILA
MRFALLFAFITACLMKSVHSCGCEYNFATSCSDGPTEGAKRLAKHFTERFGGRTEIYNCRKIEGSSTTSLHAEGRAVDLYVTGATGREAFDYAVKIACSNGIQEAIFNRRIWTSELGEHDYKGVNPHIDHVHIGLNKCGAKSFGAAS